MTTKFIFQKIDPAAFQLILNESLPKFDSLAELLSKNKIPFEVTKAKANFSLQILQMGFTPACRFQDAYFLALLFKRYGLQNVYPLNAKGPQIQFGTYLHKFPKKIWADFTWGDPLDIASFLLIDPTMPMKDVIESQFDNEFLNTYADDPNRDKQNREDEYEGYGEFTENRMDDAFEEE